MAHRGPAPFDARTEYSRAGGAVAPRRAGSYSTKWFSLFRCWVRVRSAATDRFVAGKTADAAIDLDGMVPPPLGRPIPDRVTSGPLPARHRVGRSNSTPGGGFASRTARRALAYGEAGDCHRRAGGTGPRGRQGSVHPARSGRALIAGHFRESIPAAHCLQPAQRSWALLAANCVEEVVAGEFNVR